ncbi:Fis family transcriptional regulator [Ornithinimicrobium ciconiae]|uniref:Fis family transcriptional regulator n=1 Tax=Ornithinimicrobium ciconiae TaxID=2594265 RepID=A0A516GDF2_9MICO|nr:Fis family transcriptional regulator [Ornithinimicrobium ciconiae]QDO89548.1 Fis family transcriptional regulator [Ornithinimicrobium ciconiae]
MATSTTGRPAAYCDPAQPALIIHDLTVTDAEVVGEARRWSTGRRGATVPLEELADANLSSFVSQSLAVGARAIAGAGSAQDTYELEQLISEVGARTTTSSTQAADATAKAAAAAAEAMTKAAQETRKALQESESSTRAKFSETVEVSTKALRKEVERLVGGDNPELLARLAPILDAAGQRIKEQAVEQTDKLLDKVSRQFDPADPTSPFAKQASKLAEQQAALTAAMDKNHLTLATKVDELAKAVEVQKAAAAAAARTASVTPLKGGGFEAEVDSVLEQVAAGLGDEYASTGSFGGALGRSKKGDGVLTVDGGQARVVVEMHDSTDRRVWNDYLDEAERNREAAASIGIVRDASQNQGQVIRVLGARRLVIAFDPTVDEVDLLRTVVQLMRTAALAATARRDTEGLDTAEENITAALDLLDGINKVKKAVVSIRNGATTIDTQAESLQTGITRHLSAALDALHGVAIEVTDLEAEAAMVDSDVA